MEQGHRVFTISVPLFVVVFRLVFGPVAPSNGGAARRPVWTVQAWAEQKMLSADAPRILFEQVVCDLGQVGVGTRHFCAFRFGNAGDSSLKITNVKATCGCTIPQLEKREYAPGESGVIKVIYTAGIFLIRVLGLA